MRGDAAEVQDLHERQGIDYLKLSLFLGREPATWKTSARGEPPRGGGRAGRKGDRLTQGNKFGTEYAQFLGHRERTASPGYKGTMSQGENVTERDTSQRGRNTEGKAKIIKTRHQENEKPRGEHATKGAYGRAKYASTSTSTNGTTRFRLGDDEPPIQPNMWLAAPKKQEKRGRFS